LWDRGGIMITGGTTYRTITKTGTTPKIKTRRYPPLLRIMRP
jgi:hypothetical protein